jgi:hypothetical protein
MVVGNMGYCRFVGLRWGGETMGMHGDVCTYTLLSLCFSCPLLSCGYAINFPHFFGGGMEGLRRLVVTPCCCRVIVSNQHIFMNVNQRMGNRINGASFHTLYNRTN